MAVYTIADLHLSSEVDKPMTKFGNRWSDHTEKLQRRWSALVEGNDTVVIPGDISWAMNLTEAVGDFKFIDSLPGHKIIGKGNHDYWWTTHAKMQTFLSDIGVTSVSFLRNNAFLCDGIAICGTRGWYIEEKLQDSKIDTDYEKIVSRECQRLTLSLEEAKKLGSSHSPVVFLHFPPVFADFICQPIVDVMKACGVKQCYFGHIHGKYSIPQTEIYEGIRMTLISSDFINFTPEKVFAE